MEDVYHYLSKSIHCFNENCKNDPLFYLDCGCVICIECLNSIIQYQSSLDYNELFICPICEEVLLNDPTYKYFHSLNDFLKHQINHRTQICEAILNSNVVNDKLDYLESYMRRMKTHYQKLNQNTNSEYVCTNQVNLNNNNDNDNDNDNNNDDNNNNKDKEENEDFLSSILNNIDKYFGGNDYVNELNSENISNIQESISRVSDEVKVHYAIVKPGLNREVKKYFKKLNYKEFEDTYIPKYEYNKIKLKFAEAPDEVANIPFVIGPVRDLGCNFFKNKKNRKNRKNRKKENPEYEFVCKSDISNNSWIFDCFKNNKKNDIIPIAEEEEQMKILREKNKQDIAQGKRVRNIRRNKNYYRNRNKNNHVSRYYKSKFNTKNFQRLLMYSFAPIEKCAKLIYDILLEKYKNKENVENGENREKGENGEKIKISDFDFIRNLDINKNKDRALIEKIKNIIYQVAKQNNLLNEFNFLFVMENKNQIKEYSKMILNIANRILENDLKRRMDKYQELKMEVSFKEEKQNLNSVYSSQAALIDELYNKNNNKNTSFYNGPLCVIPLKLSDLLARNFININKSNFLPHCGGLGFDPNNDFNQILTAKLNYIKENRIHRIYYDPSIRNESEFNNNINTQIIPDHFNDQNFVEISGKNSKINDKNNKNNKDNKEKNEIVIDSNGDDDDNDDDNEIISIHEETPTKYYEQENNLENKRQKNLNNISPYSKNSKKVNKINGKLNDSPLSLNNNALKQNNNNPQKYLNQENGLSQVQKIHHSNNNNNNHTNIISQGNSLLNNSKEDHTQLQLRRNKNNPFADKSTRNVNNSNSFENPSYDESKKYSRYINMNMNMNKNINPKNNQSEEIKNELAQNNNNKNNNNNNKKASDNAINRYTNNNCSSPNRISKNNQSGNNCFQNDHQNNRNTYENENESNFNFNNYDNINFRKNSRDYFDQQVTNNSRFVNKNKKPRNNNFFNFSNESSIINNQNNSKINQINSNRNNVQNFTNKKSEKASQQLEIIEIDDNSPQRNYKNQLSDYSRVADQNISEIVEDIPLSPNNDKTPESPPYKNRFRQIDSDVSSHDVEENKSKCSEGNQIESLDNILKFSKQFLRHDIKPIKDFQKKKKGSKINHKNHKNPLEKRPRKKKPNNQKKNLININQFHDYDNQINQFNENPNLRDNLETHNSIFTLNGQSYNKQEGSIAARSQIHNQENFQNNNTNVNRIYQNPIMINNNQPQEMYNYSNNLPQYSFIQPISNIYPNQFGYQIPSTVNGPFFMNPEINQERISQISLPSQHPSLFLNQAPQINSYNQMNGISNFNSMHNQNENHHFNRNEGTRHHYLNQDIEVNPNDDYS